MNTSRSVTITTCLAAVTSVFASTVGAAFGQPMAAPPGPATYPPAYPAEAAPYPTGGPSTMAPLMVPPPVEAKSESTAVWYSVGGTLAAPLLFSAIGSTSSDNVVVPGAILGIGLMMVGPSLGHFYAAGRFKVTTGMGIRVIGTAVGLGAGLALASTEKCSPATEWSGESCGQGGFALAFLVVGGSLAVGTIWDIFTAGDAARAANQRAARVSWHAAPLVMPSPNGTVTGLAVGGSF